MPDQFYSIDPSTIDPCHIADTAPRLPRSSPRGLGAFVPLVACVASLFSILWFYVCLYESGTVKQLWRRMFHHWTGLHVAGLTAGSRNDRPGLKQALEFVRSGDAICVWRLIGRCTYDFVILTPQNDVVLSFPREISVPGTVVFVIVARCTSPRAVLSRAVTIASLPQRPFTIGGLVMT